MVADFYHRGGNGPTTAGGVVLCIFIYIWVGDMHGNDSRSAM